MVMSPLLSESRGEDSFTMDGDSSSSDIAIVGFSFLFPQADSVDSFWDLLVSGRQAAIEFPSNRLCSSKFYGDDESRNVIHPKKACFLGRDIGAFDSRFFSMTAEEAIATDPQQRILLETTYRALENAGIPTSEVWGTNTSVHTGYFTADYTLLSAKDPENGPKYAATGMAGSMLSNRISTFFNLTGPSVSVDTACSSSLVALDMGCRSIRLGDSSMGIVAGCNILHTADYFMSLSKLGFLSPDGICHSFDDRANGYGRGEGFGVLIIKSLHDAIRNGDTIRAVIRATRTNQNGRTSLAQPSKEMQTQLINETYRNAQLNMSLTRYFEAHGTGTAVGDPLEAMAIGNAFGPTRGADDPMIIGALKSNIGHLEGAAGIAAVIKTILVLEKGIIPPIADLKKLNSIIDADYLKLEFPGVAKRWPTPGLRRASVNSFGFGGTNSHLVLDDAYHYLRQHRLAGYHCTAVEPSDGPRTCYYQPSLNGVPNSISNGISNGISHKISNGSSNGSSNGILGDQQSLRKTRLFVFSATEQPTASKVALRYQKFLEKESLRAKVTDEYLESLAFTLAQKRSHHPWRTFALADSVTRLIEQLSTPRDPICATTSQNIGFVFTGQGSQWYGMGKGLESFPEFRNSILDADRFLRDNLGCDWSVTEMLLGDVEPLDLDQPRLSQPLCTVLQVALVDLLRKLNIYPSTVVGHSSGEIAAAYAVGAISRESAWKLAYYRGLVSTQLADLSRDHVVGIMIAVGLSQESFQPYLEEALRDRKDGVLCVACVNSPQSITVSGDSDLVQSTQEALQKDGIFARILRVSVAYHSPHMNAIASSYKKKIRSLGIGESPPRYANMISSVTGEVIPPTDLSNGDYWVRNMVSPVLFSDAVQRIFRDTAKEARKKLDLSHRNLVSAHCLIEIGPHSTLRGPIQEIGKLFPKQKSEIAYYSCITRGKTATESLLETVGHLYCRGFDVDLAQANVLGDSHLRAPASISNLPEYPFNDTQIFWDEPKISRNIRLAAPTYNEFLGTPVPDWNPLEPRWRNVLRASSVSWLRDHKVNGEILYPGAGMLVMAIEAVNQTYSSLAIEAYEINDTSILAPLSIPEDDKGVEVQFRLKPSQDTTNKATGWASFCLYTCRNENYVEVCRGSIKAIVAGQLPPEFSEQRETYAQDIADLMHSANKTYCHGMAPEELYKRALKNGYYYGPAFQRIERANRNNHGQLIGLVGVDTPPDISIHETPAVINPGSLDSMLQLMLLAVVQDEGDKGPSTWIPTYVSRMRFSRQGLVNTSHKDRVQVHVSTQIMSSRLSMSTMHVADQHSNDLLLLAEGFEMTSITDNLAAEGPENGLPRIKRLCYDLVYRPDVSFLSSEQIAQYISSDADAQVEGTDVFEDLKVYALALMYRTLHSVTETEVVSLPFLRKQYDWLKITTERVKESTPPGISSSWLDYVQGSQFEVLRDRLRGTSQYGEALARFSTDIEGILRGKLDALRVFSEDNAAEAVFGLLNEGSRLIPAYKVYMDTVAHKNPAMRIIEVGAGTGSVTESILDALTTQTSNGPLYRFSRYDFTDLSPDLVEAASQKFVSRPKINCGVLNIDDPAYQIYEQGSYDLVIAANVLHATTSLQKSLANLRKLLREGGKLMIIEITNTASIFVQSILGYLPEWWRSAESWRSECPFATVAQWDNELISAGFTGVDIALDGSKSEGGALTSLMISSAAPYADMPNGSNGTLVPRGSERLAAITSWSEPVESLLAKKVISALDEIGVEEVQQSSFHEGATLDNLEGTHVIIVQDPSWPSLATLDTDEYAAFHTMLSKSKSIMWISDSSQSAKGVNDVGIIGGLVRTLRMEKQEMLFATATVDSSRPAVLPANLKGCLLNFFKGVRSEKYEPELIQVGDLLNIPRVYEDSLLNQKVHESTTESVLREQKFRDRVVKLSIRQPGLLDTLYFEEIELTSALEPNELEVEVKAVGISFKDCLVALGRVAEDTLGTECAGVILRAGPRCKLRPGDRVMINKLDVFRGVVRCHEKLAAKIPQAISFAEAAASVTNFVTAYHSLIRLANIQRGESVLIHSGAGGTGQAAIQIAQLCGATVYTTTSSQEKRALLKRLYGIPTEHIFNSRNLAFAQEVKRLTRGKGVDVVLNSLAGDALVASWECIAPYGRFIEIGKRDIFSHNTLPMYQFAQNVTFSAVDIGAITRERPELIGETFDRLVDLFDRGMLRTPSQLKVFPVSEVESAFRHLQSGTHAGVVAVEIDSDAVIPVVTKTRPDTVFETNETYVISGGLGGQGRSIAKWMVSKGARNLVLLSRSGAKSDKSIAFVDELRNSGANIYCPQCNIADPNSLQAVLDHCRTNMPSIKGCIQAAMDLRDGVFDNMSVEGWTKSLAPKVPGSWNLHKQLPRDLDFFIMFSSVSGIIGSQGQANYAAGNTYQDELAKFRLSRGEKAVSLNLGPLEDEGYVAENEGMAARLINMRSVMMMSQSEVFSLLDHYCNKALPIGSIQPQLITGLDIPADVVARGMEPSDWMNEPMFVNLHQVAASEVTNKKESTGDGPDLGTVIRAAESLTQAGEILANGLAGKLAKVLSIPQDTFDLGQPLHTYGVDSLIALEIRNWFLKALKVDVAVFEILSGATATTLGLTVAEKMRNV
ncbi:putative polyketide synthase [Hypomontagnella monticulosa]|nr:putative polyketide synthase [Hypomontagnella monticulosa]